MESSENDITRRLADLEGIKRLKAGYCRLLDTKQWPRLQALFAADCRFEGFGSAPSGADVATFVKGVSTRLQDCITIHHCHMPEIDFLDATRARGIWAMMDYLEWPAGFSPREAPGQQRGFFGYGYYEEEYCKVEGRWLFSFLRLTRQRIDPIPADHPSPMKGLLAPSTNWLDR
jgi:hypothetical protein